MRKVLKWGVIPLNLEGHGMDPHSFSWARINSPVNIRRFNHTLLLVVWLKSRMFTGELVLAQEKL